MISPDRHELVVFACDVALNTADDLDAIAAIDLLADPDDAHGDLDRQVGLILVTWLQHELGDEAVRRLRAKHAALLR